MNPSDSNRDRETLIDLENRGIIAPQPTPSGELEPLARRPGGLRRFLASRN